MLRSGDPAAALAEFPIKLGDIDCTARLKSPPDLKAMMDGYTIEVELYATSETDNIGDYLQSFLKKEAFSDGGG